MLVVCSMWMWMRTCRSVGLEGGVVQRGEILSLLSQHAVSGNVVVVTTKSCLAFLNQTL